MAKCPPVIPSQVDFSLTPGPLTLAPPRRERWLDLLFVLGVTLWQPILTSTLHIFHPAEVLSANSGLRLLFAVLAEAAGLAVLAYVLWKRRSGFAALTRSPQWTDVPLGIGICLLTWLVSGVVAVLVRLLWTQLTGHRPASVAVGQLLGIHLTRAWLLFLCVNPWFEELIVRGFLMTEVSALAGTGTAVLASTLVQVSYHLYQGVANAITVGVVFLCFSLYYARTRRLLPIILAHTLMDLLPLLCHAHAR